MKKKIFFLTTSLLVCLLKVSAQNELPYITKLTFNVGGGIDIPLSKLLTGQVSDHLQGYADNSFYIQPVSLTYMTFPKWGIEAQFQFGGSYQALDRGQEFQTEAQEKYGRDNFITTEITPTNSYGVFEEQVNKLKIGLVYRHEKSKYYLMPKIMIGATILESQKGDISLKEKGTNSIINIQYRPDRNTPSNLTFSTGGSVGYRLSKRFVLRVDAMYSFFVPNIVYEETTQNGFRKNIASRTLSYDNLVHIVNLGTGLTIELVHSRKK